MAERTKLTKRTVDALRPAVERYDVLDIEIPGFTARVAPDGAKTFSLRYRAGKGRGAPLRRYTIGLYGDMTVDQARAKALALRADVAHGNDPAGDRDAQKGAPTIAALGLDFLADVDARRKRTTAVEYRRQWDKHVIPALGTKRVADATTADVAKLHRALRRNGPYLANRVVALIGSFFTYAEKQGARARHTNPATDIEPYRESSRERFLTPDEIGRLGDALARAEREGLLPAPRHQRVRGKGATAKHRPKSADTPRRADPFAIGAIRFLLLTGWREQEALTLRWDAIDVARGLVTLADTKAGRDVRQIGAAALLLLSELPRIENSPYVFPGRDGDRPLVEIRRTWCAARHAAKLEDVRLHDLRHSFASVNASAGVPLLVIGKLLGHRQSTTTAKYAHLLDSPVKAAADAAAGEIAVQLGATRELRIAN